MPKNLGNISKKVLTKALSGGRGYLSSEVKKQLKQEGVSLANGRLSKQKTLKILRNLREKKLLPSAYSQPDRVYKAAAKQQFEIDQAAETVERKKHVSAHIRMDITEELAKDEASGDIDPVAQRLSRRRVVDEFSQPKKDDSTEKNSPKNTPAVPLRPVNILPETTNLPDMDIG